MQNTQLEEENSSFQVDVQKLKEDKSILQDEIKLKSDFQENKVSPQVCLINSI